VAVQEAFAVFTLLVRSAQKAALELPTCALGEARQKIAFSLPAEPAETADKASLTVGSAEKAAELPVGSQITASALALRLRLVLSAAVVVAAALPHAAVVDAAPQEKPATKTLFPEIPEQLARWRWVERAEPPAATILPEVRAAAVAADIMAAVAAAVAPTAALRTVSERVLDRVAVVAEVRRSSCVAQQISTSKRALAAIRTGSS
jgi:hypothetical protein